MANILDFRLGKPGTLPLSADDGSFAVAMDSKDATTLASANAQAQAYADDAEAAAIDFANSGDAAVASVLNAKIDILIGVDRRSEPVLVTEQLLSGATGGIASAVIFGLNQPANGRRIRFQTGGAHTFTVDFRNSPFDPLHCQIGATLSDTIDNLIALVNGHGTHGDRWKLVRTTELDKYFTANFGSGAFMRPAFQVVVVRLQDDGAGAGNFTLQVDDSGNDDGDIGTVIDFRTGDGSPYPNPAYSKSHGTQKKFQAVGAASTYASGFARAFEALADTETHRIIEDVGDAYTWNGEAQSWTQSSFAVLQTPRGWTEEFSPQNQGTNYGLVSGTTFAKSGGTGVIVMLGGVAYIVRADRTGAFFLTNDGGATAVSTTTGGTTKLARGETGPTVSDEMSLAVAYIALP